jgi:hypothetical protein
MTAPVPIPPQISVLSATEVAIIAALRAGGPAGALLVLAGLVPTDAPGLGPLFQRAESLRPGLDEVQPPPAGPARERLEARRRPGSAGP